MIPPYRIRLASLMLVTVVARADSPAPSAGPAPAVDRVGFPTGYAKTFSILRVTEDAKAAKRVTVYGNALAASITNRAALPYPNGSVIVMESTRLKKGDDGQIAKDADGHAMADAVTGLHVMRREKGFGEAYQTNRTGEWEYVEYRTDGSLITPPAQSAACAHCHVKAGPERDFVFKARFAENHP